MTKVACSFLRRRSAGGRDIPAAAVGVLAVPGAHPPQLALPAARLRAADLAAVADQVHVQLVGVLGAVIASISSWASSNEAFGAEEAEPAADPVDVDVDRDLGDAPGEDQHAGRGFAPDPGSASRNSSDSSRGAVSVQSRSGCSPSRSRIAWIRGAFCRARPPGRIASSTSATGASRTSSQVGKRSRRRGEGAVAVAVVGVLGEHRLDQLGDRVPVRLVHAAPVHLPQPVADRPHPAPVGSLPGRALIARPSPRWRAPRPEWRPAALRPPERRPSRAGQAPPQSAHESVPGSERVRQPRPRGSSDDPRRRP